jgi:uracil-DNA glycosylase
MADRLPDALRDKISQRLNYYHDIGIELFYRDRVPALRGTAVAQPAVTAPIREEDTLPRTPRKAPLPVAPSVLGTAAGKISILPPPPKASLFDVMDRIADDTLLKIRDDLGDCTRCKLHSTRRTLVFGDGNPKAELMFVGEGPGHDEDVQGLPFVGRAGKLLTQMIEAMGLQRRDVYICNVVKCRPPENRTPERDEVSTCSPFLFRQIDTIGPKVIVCLGGVAFQTLLETNRGISHVRGQWLEFRGRRLLATYHPAYLLRNPNAKGEVWKDLQKVMAVLGLEVKRGQPTKPGQPATTGASASPRTGKPS